MNFAASIFNNQRLPAYCFNESIKYHLFFPFHLIFHEAFLKNIKTFSELSGITRLQIENLDPELLKYSIEIEVDKLPDSFINATHSTLVQDYINDNISLFIMTNLAIIYSNDTQSKFGIMMNRGYDIAVLGTEDPIIYEIFKDMCLESIDEVISFMSVNFKNESVPIEIEREMRENWTDWADKI